MRSSFARTLWTALRLTLVFTIVLGIGYPVVIWGIGQVAFRAQAAGSPVHDAAGNVRGSAILAQSFTDAAGNPLPEYFQPRPSAGGYDGAASGGSNLGAEEPDLIAEVSARLAAVAAFNGVSEAEVPPDAVTASGSGLDPDISPAYAAIQVARVAAARGLTPAAVEALVAAHTTGRDLGFLGEPRVNVVELNLALDALR
jgi:K+-transporting ATPase ATPase C chain